MGNDQQALIKLLEQYQCLSASVAIRKLGIEFASFSLVSLKTSESRILNISELNIALAKLQKIDGWICFTGEVVTFIEQPIGLTEGTIPLQGEFKVGEKHVHFRYIQNEQWLWLEHVVMETNPAYLCDQIHHISSRLDKKRMRYKRLWQVQEEGSICPVIALFDGFEE